MIQQDYRCTWKPWLNEFRNAQRSRDWTCFEMHLEAMIKRVWQCTGRPWWCELGGLDHASVVIHLEAMLEQVWGCTWRPWSSKIRVEYGGGQFGASSSGGRCNGSRDSNYGFTCNYGMWWPEYNMVCHEMRDWLGAGDSRSRDDVVCGECSTEWMLYLMYTGLGVYWTRCILDSVYTGLGVYWTGCILDSVYTVLGVNCWS